MKKRVFYILFLLLLLISITYIVGQGKTRLYIHGDNPSVKSIKIVVYVDDNIVFDDILETTLLLERIDMTLNWGLHEIKVVDKTGNILLSKKVFIFFKHHLVLSHGGCQDEKASCFYLDYRMSKFLID